MISNSTSEPTPPRRPCWPRRGRCSGSPSGSTMRAGMSCCPASGYRCRPGAAVGVHRPSIAGLVERRNLAVPMGAWMATRVGHLAASGDRRQRQDRRGVCTTDGAPRLMAAFEQSGEAVEAAPRADHGDGGDREHRAPRWIGPGRPPAMNRAAPGTCSGGRSADSMTRLRTRRLIAAPRGRPAAPAAGGADGARRLSSAAPPDGGSRPPRPRRGPRRWRRGRRAAAPRRCPAEGCRHGSSGTGRAPTRPA